MPLLSEEVFYIKIVGTTSSEPVYATMVAATTINVTRWEIELACLWVMPLPRAVEGESGVAWSGAMWKSRRKRKQFEIEFYPFSNTEAVAGDILQNTDQLQTLESIIDKPYVWLADPTTSGKALPPRYTDGTNFPLTNVLLPLRVECDEPSYGKTDEGNTEATMLAEAREL